MSIKREEEILKLLDSVKYLDTNEICKKIGLSRRYVRKLIDILYTEGKVRITGPAKNPLWYLVKPMIKQCVGCGFCCIQAKCQAGLRLYKSSDRCNALIWSEIDKRYYCDLMTLPGIIGEGYRKELYSGEGCCSNLNSWRNKVIKRDEVKKEVKVFNLDPLFQIFLRCLGMEMMGGDSVYLMVSNFQSELLKRDKTKEETNLIINLVLSNIKNNRNILFENFMGEIPKI